jgi:S-adenosylmethionine:tRNA ribosyltransferase-isomerase
VDDLDAWDFDLPEDRIASRPVERRDDSRLMRVNLSGGKPEHHAFRQLPQILRPGDLLVANNTSVLPARVFAQRASGGRVELLFLGPGPGEVSAMARPMRRLIPGERLLTRGGLIEIVGRDPEDPSLVRVRTDPEPLELMARAGVVPLPPYLGREADQDDRRRYQTVYADRPGSAAAPTAGLHFTPELLTALAARGIGWATVTLHVGIGTFRPLRPEDLERGELHAEPWSVPEATAAAIARTRASGGRVIAVGTTTTRTLASAFVDGEVRAGSGVTSVFLRPPATIGAIDGLITNFHLPRSSLLMLVACLVGRERLLAAYREAIARGYRFYSYGDAMLLV